MPGEGGGGGFGSSDALAFGMMNSLRTGNPHYDMLVVVLVPLVMASIASVPTPTNTPPLPSIRPASHACKTHLSTRTRRFVEQWLRRAQSR